MLLHIKQIMVKERKNNIGIMSLPLYGTDLGTAIEVSEKLIAKIKTGKYDKETLLELAKANTEIISYAIQHED